MISSPSDIKRAQKESLLQREISFLFMQAGLDDPKLQKVSLTRVALSPDKGLCTVFFYAPEGEEYFNRALLPILTQYQPSLRRALAARIRSRYTPELRFTFDTQLEKQLRIENLIEKVKQEDK